MTQFEVVMMCGGCRIKIMDELKSHGYKNFDLDMATSILTFQDDVFPKTIIRIVSALGYPIKHIERYE